MVRLSWTEVAHQAQESPYQLEQLLKILPRLMKGNTQDSSVEPSQEASPELKDVLNR